jgi:hypothetical protein
MPGRREFLKSGIALGRLSVMPALSETELAATEVNDSRNTVTNGADRRNVTVTDASEVLLTRRGKALTGSCEEIDECEHLVIVTYTPSDGIAVPASHKPSRWEIYRRPRPSGRGNPRPDHLSECGVWSWAWWRLLVWCH